MSKKIVRCKNVYGVISYDAKKEIWDGEVVNSKCLRFWGSTLEDTVKDFEKLINYLYEGPDCKAEIVAVMFPIEKGEE